MDLEKVMAHKIVFKGVYLGPKFQEFLQVIQGVYPFYAVLFLYPLKISGNPWLNDIFREYKKGAMT